MKTLKKIGNIAILILILSFIVGRLISNKRDYESELTLMQDTEIEVPVTVCSPEYLDFKQSFSASGTFQAQNTVNVVAETSGKIIQFPEKEGTFIHENGAIASIENGMLLKDYNLAQHNYEKAERDFSRFQNLKSGEAISKNKLEEVELVLENAETAMANAKERLDNSEVLAPISGYITKVYEEKGDFVSPGIPIVEITNIDKVKIPVYLSSSQLQKVNDETEIMLTCKSFPNTNFKGELFCVGKKANDSGRFPVTIVVKNSGQKALLPGMTGIVSFNTPAKETLVIPRSAISGSIKIPEVYVVYENHAIKKTIAAMSLSSEYVAVLDGLKEDDSIVLTGQFNLSDSTKIRIVSNAKN